MNLMGDVGLKKMNKIFIKIIVASIFFCCASILNAHEIHRKDGRIIVSDSVWEEDDIVKYKKYGATIGIDKELVKNINYTENIKEERTHSSQNLKERWEYSRSDKVRKQSRAGQGKIDTRTGLVAVPGSLVSYQSISDPLAESVTDQDFKDVIPKKGHSAMDDPKYRAMVEERERKQAELRNKLMGVTHGSVLEIINRSLDALNDFHRLTPGEKDYRTKYREKYKEFEKTVTGENGINNIDFNISHEEYEKYQSRMKTLIQMYRVTKRIYNVYFNNTDRERELKNKLGEDKFKIRRMIIAKQLLYTTTLLSHYGAGGDSYDLKIVREGGRNKWGRFEECGIYSRAHYLMKYFTKFSWEELEAKWDGLTRGTKYEGVKYGPGMHGGMDAFLKFIKEREEMLEGNS